MSHNVYSLTTARDVVIRLARDDFQKKKKETLLHESISRDVLNYFVVIVAAILLYIPFADGLFVASHSKLNNNNPLSPT